MSRSDGRGWSPSSRKLRVTSKLAAKIEKRLSKDLSPQQRLTKVEDALDVLIRTYGPDGGPAANGRSRVADELEAMDRYPEARLLRQEALDALRHHLGNDHPSTITAETMLARNFLDSGLGIEARPLLRHIHDAEAERLGPDNKGTVWASKWLEYLDSELGSD
jgi:hypothetical protein